MDYILFNSDGSIATKQLKNFVHQGSEGVNTFFVSVDELENPNQYECEAVFTLPDGSQNILVCDYQSSYTYDEDEEPRQGWTFALTLAQTLYQGLLLVAIRLRLNANNILVTYPFALVINETGVAPDTDTGIPLSSLDYIIDYFKGYVDSEKGTKLYKHRINIFYSGGPTTWISSNGAKLTSLDEIYYDYHQKCVSASIGQHGQFVPLLNVIALSNQTTRFIYLDTDKTIVSLDIANSTTITDIVTEL